MARGLSDVQDMMPGFSSVQLDDNDKGSNKSDKFNSLCFVCIVKRRDGRCCINLYGTDNCHASHVFCLPTTTTWEKQLKTRQCLFNAAMPQPPPLPDTGTTGLMLIPFTDRTACLIWSHSHYQADPAPRKKARMSLPISNQHPVNNAQ